MTHFSQQRPSTPSNATHILPRPAFKPNFAQASYPRQLSPFLRSAKKKQEARTGNMATGGQSFYELYRRSRYC